MPTPPDALIQADIKSTLESITAGNGYKTTVATVADDVREWADMSAMPKPWLGIMLQSETPEYQPGNQLRVTATFSLVGQVEAHAPIDARAAMSDLKDDLIAALNADQTRGGNATSTTINSLRDDASDPDAQGVATLVSELAVVYFRSTESS